MRRVRLTSAVKMDQPYIVGDLHAVLTLDDVTAEFAIRHNLGVAEGGSFEVGPTRAELEAVEARLGTLKRLDDGQTYSDPSTRELAAVEDREADEVAAEDDAELAEAALPKRPYGNAPKSAWIRYAVAMDPELTEERAETWTKADLMSRFGARLGEED